MIISQQESLNTELYRQKYKDPLNRCIDLEHVPYLFCKSKGDYKSMSLIKWPLISSRSYYIYFKIGR